MIQKNLANLLEYARVHLGLKNEDTVYELNRLAEKLQLDSVEDVAPDCEMVQSLDCPDCTYLCHWAVWTQPDH